MPEWSRDILIGWVPEGIAAIFGLGDEEVGKAPGVLFDHKADLLEWRAPQKLGTHGANDFNLVVRVDGGDEGVYDCFFEVDLFDVPTQGEETRRNALRIASLCWLC